MPKTQVSQQYMKVFAGISAFIFNVKRNALNFTLTQVSSVA